MSRLTKDTIRHYEENANEFWEGTKDHDVTQNYEAFLSALPKEKPLKILDFGCGPGRDLFYFKKLGHEPTGLDGCLAFCKMAEAYAGCPVLHHDFLELDLPPQSFDGIFANASLFHIPSKEFVRVLKDFHATLKPGGILFSSNPRGTGEGWNGDRFGYYMEFDVYQEHLKAAGFEVLTHYYRPKGLPCKEQPWLAVVSRKV